MIRVLQIVTRLAVRGVPRHVLDLAGRLDPTRFQVDVLAGSSEPGEGSLLAEARERSIPTVSVPVLRRDVHPVGDAAAYRAIRRHLADRRYQVVHTHISKAGVLGRVAARRAGVPVIVHTYHGRVGELERGGMAARALLAAERFAAARSDALVAVSEDTARYLAEHGIGTARQRRVIGNGVDLDRFRPAAGEPRSPGRVIAGIGSLTSEKGYDVLLDAVALLPDVHLRLAGDGPLRATLEAHARRAGVAGRVRFEGTVPDVRPLLDDVDLVVLPSHREGSPLTLLEAMAMAKPVVASRVGGVAEMTAGNDGARLVPPGDAHALARAVGELLDDPGRLGEMGRAARRHVEAKYSVARMVDGVAALYEELLARG